MFRFRVPSLVVCTLLASAISATAVAQSTSKVSLVRNRIDDTKTVTFRGNVRPEATAGNDRGAVDESMPLKEMRLLLARSPESQAAFDQYLQDLQNPKSANFHKWLTAVQIGQKFGPADEDIARLTEWMTGKGFTVSGVSPDGMLMTFDGTAGQVQKAFHEAIHNLSVNGTPHIANMSDPEIPEALAPVVAGVLPVNDFKPHAMSIKRAAAVKPNVAVPNGFNAIGAADLAAIYNFNPLFKAGITGKGQTIYVMEDSDVFSVDDFTLFRKAFGLTRPYPFGNLTQVHPTGAVACTDPGINADDGESEIDVEYSSAAAPNASIVLASCSDSKAAGAGNFGGFIAMLNLLNSTTSPSIISISFGESESEVGSAGNLFINNLYALGAAEGASIFVSSGDEGAASSDADRVNATHGIAVSGFTSTPNNVSVGGTDYGDTFLGQTATYFSATDGANFQTAKSYVPEIPWNDSCASQLIYTFSGFASAVGPNGFCNSPTATTNDAFLSTASGSGGPSGCATGAPTTAGVVGGTCAGYAKPSWQAGLLGNPADGVRDIPDVSLFAANGVWNHFYAVCFSDTDTARTEGDAAPCTADPSTWAGFGGTSVSSPIWAGIQALVNQRTGTVQGNPNPVLYSIANAEYGASGNAGCNSTLGNGANPSCVFYDVTLGDMDVNCTSLTSRGTVVGTFNCFNGGGAEGVLSISNTVLEPAYGTNVGWDFATGIGTTNATNLVNNPAWPTATP